jgi:hypothetical protein
MFRFKLSHLLLFPLLALIPASSSIAESHYCIEVDGGFGHGGTTFIGTGFAVPAGGACIPWAGFTKTASSVILTTSGTGCLSSSGKVLTVSVLSADTSFFGTGQTRADFIRLTRTSTTAKFTSGEDSGAFSGSAAAVSCSSSLEQLPDTHD